MSTHSKTAPFLSKIIARELVTKPGSTKMTWHIALDLTDSSLTYAVGDSIAVIPENCPSIVARYITALGYTGDESVTLPKSGEVVTLELFLRTKANLSRLTSAFCRALMNHIEDAKLIQNALDNESLLAEFLKSYEPLELLEKNSHSSIPLEEIPLLFASMLPRFYSIASCQKTYPNQVHLTVTLSSYTYKNEVRYGVATHYLCHLAKESKSAIPIYLQPNHGFTLPVDGSVPILMIGPGTGVAPFRAFMQERVALQHKGRNWLFFGERESAYDFYYEEEWNELIKCGHLKLTTAFSRDQEEKIYVQNRLLENAQELWKFLEEGAIIYICGDATNMAKDVDNALHQIAQSQGGMSEVDARAFFKSLRKTKRYLLDVY